MIDIWNMVMAQIRKKLIYEMFEVTKFTQFSILCAEEKSESTSWLWSFKPTRLKYYKNGEVFRFVEFWLENKTSPDSLKN